MQLRDVNNSRSDNKYIPSTWPLDLGTALLYSITAALHGVFIVIHASLVHFFHSFTTGVGTFFFLQEPFGRSPPLIYIQPDFHLLRFAYCISGTEANSIHVKTTFNASLH